MATPNTSGRLAKKTAIVTGGGFGFGQGIVEKFIHEGAKVLIVDINADNGQKVAASQPDGTAAFSHGDVSKEDDWKAAVKKCVEVFGRLDIVVNNAGVVNKMLASIDIPEEEFDRLFRINAKSIYQSARACVPQLTSQTNPTGGVFINVSSVSAPRPRPNLVWYASTKGAVTAATKGLAAEHAKLGIRWNAVLPVAGETAMASSLTLGEDTPEKRAAVTAGIPLGRWAQPRDVANAVAFLASEEADFITGATLRIDGGRSLN
ncbi:MAG: Dehydrogenase reductase SDR member 4 [Chrysothrix sp. TS-e1954]|nr:MAG: Dehydrogenase reductase SDR member 4 [Chrysothrix sp. TS-e1954]